MDKELAYTILAEIDTLPQNAIIEVGVHPGYKEEWCQYNYDDFIDCATKLKASGKNEIINWNQV
ncbi:MAG: hypothetical protein EOM36_01005 [Bacteroidia bacterium]|nr:hypothetical protein [Bacteroidia bacterium]